MTGDDWISRRFPHWHKIRGSPLSIVRPHKFGITLLKNWPFHLGDINALKMQNLTLILILFTNLWQHHIPVKWSGWLFWNYHWGIISTIFHRETNEKVYTSARKLEIFALIYFRALSDFQISKAWYMAIETKNRDNFAKIWTGIHFCARNWKNSVLIFAQFRANPGSARKCAKISTREN